MTDMPMARYCGTLEDEVKKQRSRANYYERELKRIRDAINCSAPLLRSFAEVALKYRKKKSSR